MEKEFYDKILEFNAKYVEEIVDTGNILIYSYKYKDYANLDEDDFKKQLKEVYAVMCDDLRAIKENAKKYFNMD